MARTAQIIRDENGKAVFAVVPYDEYERLIEAAEDAEDVRDFDTYMATRPETFPAGVVDRLVAGEHPVRVFREYRGMSQAALADAAGITQVYVSQIEAGRREGKVDVLARIAEALKVPLDSLT